jgi:tricorn protease
MMRSIRIGSAWPGAPRGAARRSYTSTLLATLLLATPLAAQTRLLRFPDIHGDLVVFSYAGDLWRAPADGGTAVRLTASPGQELFARFSPDGQWIAFTGQYDGDEQVYVMPAAGGVPKQLTFYPAQGPLAPRWGYDNQVYGWTPDGKGILFRSTRDSWDLATQHLYVVPAQGGLPVQLPMPRAGAGTFSPDGRELLYSPLFRDFRAWKRYSGGWAEDLWVFDIATHDAKNITNNPRTDRDPMWIGDRVYFDSDRTGTLNLYSEKPDGSDPVQLTRSTTWDVRWPSADATGRIVYEMDGVLHVFDTKTSADRTLDINVPDDGVAWRPEHRRVDRWIEDFGLSPKGERALFVARGDVFTAPIEDGPTRNLTHTSTAHDKGASWSPDGRQIAFISDMSGEEELYLIDQDGSGKPEQLTSNGDVMRYAPQWAPDGKHLCFSDARGRLWVLDLTSRKTTLVARDTGGTMFDQSWSADGHWLAFSMGDDAGYRSLYIWGVGDAAPHRVTGGISNDYEPVFDPDGKYLFFLSDREYAPQISTAEWSFATTRTTGIFALALRPDVPPPFPPKSDEVAIDSTAKAAGPAGGRASGAAGAGSAKGRNGAGQAAAKPADTAAVRIDFAGLADRIAPVPVEADNYRGLVALEGKLVYMRTTPFFYGRSSGSEPAVVVFDMKQRKATTLAEGAFGYALSADGSKILVRQGGSYNLYDLAQGASSKKTVSTAGLEADIVPKQEWNEIYDEVWRRFRDFFYVPTMNGYDWKALREQYRPLLQYVGDRSDLDYVLNEMIAELSNSHTYISGGDHDIPPRAEVALPGARFALDSASGRYRIASIFQGDNAEEEYRSPLTEIGVDAHVGDYVLAIDGQDLRAPDNPYRLLRNRADHPVTLLLNSRPSSEGARKVSFRPTTSEQKLIYYDWVAGNRERVQKMTGGRVGYLHLPDMGADGLTEFIKWYYPQIRKEGLIIDVRGNGGGNISSMVIERLSKTLLASGYSRNSDFASTYPRGPVFYGSMVALLNETSASDGDIFPAMFKQAGLGPLIGKRSWGGVTGITDHGPLIDGGSVNVPEFGFTSVDGSWIIEGHGVDPDIVVENDPKSVLEGRDPQLERAVQEVLKLMQAHPRHLPSRPTPPNRTGH